MKLDKKKLTFYSINDLNNKDRILYKDNLPEDNYPNIFISLYNSIKENIEYKIKKLDIKFFNN